MYSSIFVALTRKAKACPLIVIATADNQFLEKEEELASLSTQGKYLFAEESSHFVPFDRPDINIAAVRQMLGQ